MTGFDALGIEAVVPAERLSSLRESLRSVHIQKDVAEYVIDVIRATREDPSLSYGASTRAATALVQAARVWAGIDGRDFDVGMHRHWIDPTLPFAEVVLNQSQGTLITSATLLDDIAGGADRGSFTITDSSGAIGAVNLIAEGITTVGGLMDAINSLGIGVQASLNDAATGLAITDTAAGAESLVIADTGSGVAAASLGIAGTGSVQTVGGVSVTALVGPAESSDDTVTSGLSFTLKEVTSEEITIDVENDSSTVVSAAESLVSQYNLLVDKIDSLTFFNADTDEVGLLFGSSETLRIQTGYSRLLSGRIVGAGDLKSIGQVGLGFTETGKLELSTSKLQKAIENGSQDVEEFFSTSDSGLAAKLDSLAEKLAGETNSMLLNRSETLTTQIEFNNDRIDALNLRLENERERLLRQYYSMEQAIAKIQSNQQAVSQIAPISIPT